jgi:peptide/nickel transport system substrate-binding protein
MRKRLWLLAGAVVAVLVIATSAAATSRVAGSASASRGTPAATPFAKLFAHTPKTVAARKAKLTTVWAEEQDINGFNTNLNCCNQLAGGLVGNYEAIHGAFNLNDKGQYFMDLVSSAKADKNGIVYKIRPDAYWYDGGKKVKVTPADFIYTWQQLNGSVKSNDLVSTTGYDQIASVTGKGDTVIAKWKKCPAGGPTADNPCGFFADWQSLFGGLYPSFALRGLDFNKIWTNCICDAQGNPVSDGPFYLAAYTKGQGTVLKKNPYYYKPAKLNEVDFKFIADSNSEVQAMRGGEVDGLMSPTFGQNLAPLQSTPGVTFESTPGYFFEHLDLQEGPKSQNPLLRAPWMREAIMMGIDRQAIINTIYGSLAKGLKPLDSAVYFQTQKYYVPHFRKWNYNPSKALALLKKHCSGGPSKVDPGTSAEWTCSGYPATFRFSWTASNPTRATQEAIIEAQLKAIGIKIVAVPRAANVFFGQYVSQGDYDIVDFAWVSPDGDPSGYFPIWSCGGDSNYLHYCSKKASDLMQKGQSETDPARRAALWNAADAIMAAQVPTIPLYQRPAPLAYNSNLLGVKNNPATLGATWNIEDWHWKA